MKGLGLEGGNFDVSPYKLNWTYLHRYLSLFCNLCTAFCSSEKADTQRVVMLKAVPTDRHCTEPSQPTGGGNTEVGVRDRSLITEIEGLQNGKIAGVKPSAPPPLPTPFKTG